MFASGCENVVNSFQWSGYTDTTDLSESRDSIKMIIKENQSLESHVMELSQCDLKIRGAIVESNTATSQSTGIFAAFCKVEIEGAAMRDQGHNTFRGGFLALGPDVSAAITNSSFINGLAETGGAIFASGSHQLIIQKSVFNSNRAETGGAVHAANCLLLDIRGESVFEDNIGSEDGSQLNIDGAGFYLAGKNH